MLAGDTPVVESHDLHEVREYLADWAGQEVLVLTGPADPVMARTSTSSEYSQTRERSPAARPTTRRPRPRMEGDPDDATFDGFWIAERLFRSARWEKGDTAPNANDACGAAMYPPRTSQPADRRLVRHRCEATVVTADDRFYGGEHERALQQWGARLSSAAVASPLGQRRARSSGEAGAHDWRPARAPQFRAPLWNNRHVARLPSPGVAL